MDQQRFQQVKELVLAALEQAPEARDAFLQAACAGDAELRAEVEALLPDGDDELTEDFLAPLPLAPPAAAAESNARVGQRVGAYEIEEQIGSGGMGEVYRARRVDDFQQIVALKFVRPGGDAGETLWRFKNEMQLLAVVGEHPNIARLLDAGTTDDGAPYFVMEYVDGQSIDRHCDALRLTIRQRLELFGDVCQAVRFAHQHAVIHRDIKPSNILITSDGTPKLIDFGIAKLTTPEAGEPTQAFRTAPQARVLTPHYASPEQMRGERVSTATDVYSLGVVLYELLSGHRPYELSSERPIEWATVVCETSPRKPSTVLGDKQLVALDEAANGSTAETVASARHESPRSLARALRGDLDNIVLMALRKEVERRYASVEQFAEDISRHLRQLPVRARRDSFGYRTGRFLRRNRVAAALALLVLTSLVVGIIGTASQAVRAQRSAEVARREAERANLEAEASQSVTTFLAELYESAAPHAMAGLRFGTPRSLAPDLQSRSELSAKNARLIIDQLSARPALQVRLLDAIGNAYVGMGRLDEAAPLLEKSREIIARDPAAKDDDIARNLSSFAWLRFMQGRYREAEPPLRKALAMHRTTSGELADETLQSKLHLALLLATLEVEHNEAESLVREVIDARRAALGADHPRVGFALLFLSLVHASAQQQQRALGPALQAARIFASHPETSELAQGLSGIASSVVQARLGNKQNAVELARKSIEQIRQLLGDDHPLVVQQSVYVPRLLEEIGSQEQAKELYNEALEDLRSRGEGQSYAYARNVERLGIIAAARGENDEAEPYLREALDIYRRCLRDDSWRVGWTLAYLGIVERQKGDFDAALATLSEATEIFQRAAADSPLDSTSWGRYQLKETRRELADSKPSP